MTDREILLIAYGALELVCPRPQVLERIEAHLFGDKPSEPSVDPLANVKREHFPELSKNIYRKPAPMFEPEPTTSREREPGTPGVDRPLKRGDVLK